MTFDVYGVKVISNYDLSALLPLSKDGIADVRFTCVDEPPSNLDLGPGKVEYEGSVIRIGRHGEWDVMSFEDSTVFFISRTEIVCHLKRTEHEFLVPIQLLGLVMALWLETRGQIVLHASAVATSQGALLFLAGGKAGKTSLAAAFAANGDAIVTEDLAAISVQEKSMVQPGYPLVRMWPESVSHFLENPGTLTIYHPAFDKVWVPVRLLGGFHPAPVEISRIFLPERRSDGPVEIRPLSQMEAVKSLLAGSFLADLIEPASDVAGRFEKVARIVDSAPVHSLIYPEGFEHLQIVRDAVLADAA